MAKELKKNKAQMVMPESKEDKKKALESAIAHILKTYGSGAVMRLGQANTMQVDAIPTGSMTLDLALGIGGVPRGRIVELYGPESSGKTTVALTFYIHNAFHHFFNGVVLRFLIFIHFIGK